MFNHRVIQLDRHWLEKLHDLSWYRVKKVDGEIRIMATLDVKQYAARAANSISTAINHYAASIQKKDIIKASFQRKHNIVHMSEAAFTEYFKSIGQDVPTILDAKKQHVRLFHDKTIDKLDSADEKRLDKLPTFSWYRIKTDSKTCIMTILNTNEHAAHDTSTAINRYAASIRKQDIIKASFQIKNNILYMSEAAFAAYFKSIGQDVPTIFEAKKQHVRLFYAKTITKLNSTEEKYLDKLPTFSWYRIKVNDKIHVMTILDKHHHANNISVAINRYAASIKKQGIIKASSQMKNNILHMSEAAFAAYFASIKKKIPRIFEGRHKHLQLFNGLTTHQLQSAAVKSTKKRQREEKKIKDTPTQKAKRRKFADSQLQSTAIANTKKRQREEKETKDTPTQEAKRTKLTDLQDKPEQNVGVKMTEGYLQFGFFATASKVPSETVLGCSMSDSQSQLDDEIMSEGEVGKVVDEWINGL